MDRNSSAPRNEAGRKSAAIHAMWMIEYPSLEPTISQDDVLAKKGGAAEIKKELEAIGAA
jgi:hypothetical protein